MIKRSKCTQESSIFLCEGNRWTEFLLPDKNGMMMFLIGVFSSPSPLPFLTVCVSREIQSSFSYLSGSFSHCHGMLVHDF